MSVQDSLRKAREFIKSEKGVIAPLPISEEDLNPGVQADASVQAYPIEPTTSCYPVHYDFPDESACSEFSFFEDGRQRTVHIGYIPIQIGKNRILIPIHFFVVAAVILQREQRELKVWGKPEIQRGILVEKSLIPDQSTLQQFEHEGLLVVDTQAIGGDYYELRRSALREAKDRRLAVENELIERWRQSDAALNHFLVVDGTLMNLRNERNVAKMCWCEQVFRHPLLPYK